MKNAMETSLSVAGKINSRYDMNHDEMNEIYQATKNDAFEMIYEAFRIGYMKGEKAAKAEVKVRLVEKPKYKNEYRTAISNNLKTIKNTMDLENLYKLTCLYIRTWDNDNFVEEDVMLYLILNNFMRAEYPLKYLKDIHTFIKYYTQDERRDR